MSALRHLMPICSFLLTGCWSTTAMDLKPMPLASVAAVGSGQRMMIAIQPQLGPKSGPLGASMKCLKRGGSFEKMLCDVFVDKLKAAGYAGEAVCQAGPPPAKWQNSFSFLYEQKVRVTQDYLLGRALAAVVFSLLLVMHKAFDVEIHSEGTLTWAGGTKVDIRHDNSLRLSAGNLLLIPFLLLWTNSEIANEILLCTGG